MERKSSTERQDSDFLRLRDSYCRLIEDHGLQYKFVSYDQVEAGELLQSGYRIFILPRSSALSASEASAITDFVRQGGTLVIDGDAGTFDEHSRRLPKSSLAGLLSGDTGRGRVVSLSALPYAEERVLGTGNSIYNSMTKVTTEAAVQPAFGVLEASGESAKGIETHVFRNGGITIVGLTSNPPIDVDGLGSLKVQAEQRFDKTRPVRLIAPGELYAYDIRRRQPLGKVKQLSLKIDPFEPTIIAFSASPIPKLSIHAPLRIERGKTGRIGLALEGHSEAETDVLHVDVLGPDGRQMAAYTGNVMTRSGGAETTLPVAMNDPAGTWTIMVKELLGGQIQKATIEVF